VLEIDEGVGRPEAVLQLLSSEQSARLLKKKGENLERSTGEMYLPTVLAEFAGTEINLVGVETKPIFEGRLVAHLGKAGRAVYPGRGRNSRSPQ
jgi:hypothetical protein